MADRDRPTPTGATPIPPPGASRRRSDYRPPLPEEQSALSRWLVRAQLALIAVMALAVLVHVRGSDDDDNTPITIANAPKISSPMISSAATGSATLSTDGPDAAKGQVLYLQSCTYCHGQSAQGMPHMGVDLRNSKFISSTSDPKLIAFLRSGRRPTDPKNITGLLMPPRGGNVTLDDESLADIVAFLRQLQKEQRDQDAGVTPPPTSRPVAQNMLDLITGAP